VPAEKVIEQGEKGKVGESNPEQERMVGKKRLFEELEAVTFKSMDEFFEALDQHQRMIEEKK